MGRKAIETCLGRHELNRIIRKLDRYDKTEWWQDMVEIIPEPIFDTKALSWDGCRHLENIIYWRANKLNKDSFRSWNSSVVSKQLEEVRRKRNLASKEIDYLWSMVGMS